MLNISAILCLFGCLNGCYAIVPGLLTVFCMAKQGLAAAPPCYAYKKYCKLSRGAIASPPGRLAKASVHVRMVTCKDVIYYLSAHHMNNIYICISMQREQSYQEALNEIKGIIEGEQDLIANLANTVAILKEKFNFWWIGFYLVKGEQLVLGPFQGPVACTRIAKGKGVCGTSWQKKETLLVGDVHQFPGHIACSAASNSEIVVPIIKNNEVVMVLDVDSTHYNHFNETDKKYLEDIAVLMAQLVE